MRRRRTLHWLVSGGVVAVSGCALIRPGEQSSVQPTPESPDDSTDEAVVEYVQDHAATTVANRMIRDRGASSVSIDCRAVVSKRTNTGLYLVTECDGSAQFDDKSGSFTTTLFYAVTDRATVPVDNEQVRDTELYESGVESENLDKWSGIDVSNFDGIDHNVTVLVSDTERAGSDPILEQRLTLSSQAGLDDFWRIRKAGTYEVKVERDDGPERTFRWQVVEEQAWAGLWIAITPDDQLIACGAVDSECATTYPLPPESETLTPR